MKSLLLLCTLVSVLEAAASAVCYFPNGVDKAPDDMPCDPNAEFSACCGKQVDGSPAYCLANGLCLSDYKLSRGSCTDSNWQSPDCAQVCRSRMSHPTTFDLNLKLLCTVSLSRMDDKPA